MTRRLLIRRRAFEDLDDIAAAIQERSLTAAHRFIDSALYEFERLLDFPELGTVGTVLSPAFAELRVWPITHFENYLIFYKASPTHIEIIRVLHGSRDFPNLLL